MHGVAMIPRWPLLWIKHVHVCYGKKTFFVGMQHRQTSNVSRTLVGNKIVDHSDVAGAPPVGAAPTTSSFST